MVEPIHVQDLESMIKLAQDLESMIKLVLVQEKRAAGCSQS